MEVQQIDVYIDALGEVRIEVRGTHGRGCLDLTRDLEGALGGQIMQREMTPESMESGTTESQRVWQRGG